MDLLFTDASLLPLYCDIHKNQEVNRFYYITTTTTNMVICDDCWQMIQKSPNPKFKGRIINVEQLFNLPCSDFINNLNEY